MTSGLDAVGDMATGAVLAGAVEPGHGGKGGDGHGACLNCGTPLTGAYCHACGQSAHVHRTLMGFGHDLVHGVFHFEGKFWNTLPMLFFKPGELTRRYIHGERARFVSPVAMFLFCVFLMFAVVGGLAGSMSLNEQEAQAAKVLTTPNQLNAQLAKTEAAIEQTKAEIRAAEKAGKDSGALDGRLESLEGQREGLREALHFVPDIPIVSTKGGKLLDFRSGWAPLDHGLEQVNANPDLFLYRLKTSAYKYSWMLIPISTPLVWLLFFWKREYKVYDHLIFVTFSLIFMSLLITLGSLFGALGVPQGWILTAITTIIPFHMYRQLRGAYLGSRTGAVIRTVLLLWFAFWALIVYAFALLAMGLMH